MLATKNGSHCCSNTNRCSGRQVHIDMWWLRMCLTHSTMDANKQVKIWHCQHCEDLYSAWLVLYWNPLIDMSSEDLSTPNRPRLKQFLPSRKNIWSWHELNFYVAWSLPSEIAQSQRCTACMGAGPCGACGIGAGSWSARCSWTTPDHTLRADDHRLKHRNCIFLWNLVSKKTLCISTV